MCVPHNEAYRAFRSGIYMLYVMMTKGVYSTLDDFDLNNGEGQDGLGHREE